MLKTASVALILALSPLAATAEGCEHDRQAAATCADGHTWDAEASACVPIASS
ncbi:hypothetical protein [Frigidibacter sp. ROC022]|uniref:hypothetical protein n=1 Tax=Frigidibacter sp. ROC022 TaxID=2971796 RepID=UPI00215AE233|nr:hypothetical protein [Frigidibacter sp. ROC022]MCR8726301.1 hypothetical protein [Frigidibacter sp. ROC022]